MKKSGLKPGDRVTWNTSQGRTTGIIEKKLTHPTNIKSHPVKASPENAEYLVQSLKSGGKAAHKTSALRRTG